MLFVRFILIVVLMFSFSTSSVAKGPFNRIFHNDWFSENSPVPGAIESRMGTNGNDGSIFVVYFSKNNNCKSGFPVILYSGVKPGGPGVRKIPGKFAIDRGNIVNITFSVTYQDGLLFMGVDGLDGHGVFQGAVDGKTAEFSFFLENMGNRYVDYSLIGFTAAYNRAQNLCRGDSAKSTPKPQKKDKDFFEGGTGIQKKKDKSEDASYF